MSDPLDRAVDGALNAQRWSLTITPTAAGGLHLHASGAVHPEEVPLLLQKAALEIAAKQFLERRKAAPLVQVPGLLLPPNGARGD